MEYLDTDNLTASFLAGGLGGIDTHLRACPAEGNQRLKLLDSIRQKISSRYISEHLLGRMHEIYEACVEEALGSVNGNDAGDEELLMYANVTSYNLAANLADCWLDAEEPRSDKHFNAGLVAAKRCLDLRRQLNKPPAAMAMAYFVKGVHEYSLKDYPTAEITWSSKLENEISGRDESAPATEDLDILLSHGLINLARFSQGLEDETGYQKILQRLESRRNASNENEIDLFLDELRLLKEKHGPC